MVRVQVPATSANIGPGFDCLGLALNLYNYISFEEAEDGLFISGCKEKFAGPDNYAAKAYYAALENCGAEKPSGLRISIESYIPVSRGLGSSASLYVAGIVAADKIHNLGMTKAEMLALADRLEGHPDNAAPAIYGGLTAAVVREGEAIVADYKVNENLKFTALVPDFETSTEKARALLPDTINRKDAVYTVGCLSMLIKGFETGDREFLAAALDDLLHQPYRKTLIPGFDEIKKAALSFGADGLVISGSGSTLLAVGGPDYFGDSISSFLKDVPGNWKVYSLKPSEGATVL